MLSQKWAERKRRTLIITPSNYDREIRGKDDNPTIGLILCTGKNDAMVKYVLDKKNKQVFASRYQLTLIAFNSLD